MNYQGKPCKQCREIILHYSLSGLCRRCWHKNHPSKQLSIEERIQRHAKDPFHYHYLIIDGVAVAEHRYVWEKAKGQIPHGGVIHHLNGLKGDNRLENLLALPRSDHDSKDFINHLRARIRLLEKHLKETANG